jgi:membrane-associated protease RseP (regulator of RpoE activity)
MNIRTPAAAALLCAVLLPGAAGAQQTPPPPTREATIYAPAAGRGMLGLMTEAVRGAQPSRQRVIRDVVPESPAQRAGLVAGDTIVRINGLAATEQVMNSPFEPGDTVVLRVRSGGTERDVTVVAAPRAGMTYRALALPTGTPLPDTVMRQISVIMSNVREHVENLHRVPLTIERSAGDSSVILRYSGDTVRILRHADMAGSMTLADSALARLRVPGDARRFEPPGIPFVLGDSVRLRVFTARPEGIDVDTIRYLRASDIVESNVFIGMRSFAGAEVAPLNPRLAEYFSVTEGVLILDVREGTPAARAGLQPGDVIVQVNAVAVSSLAEVRGNMTAAPPGSAVQVRVLRRGQPLDVSISR